MDRITVLAILLLAGACTGLCGGRLNAAPLVPYVRQVDYEVQTFSEGGCAREAAALFVLYVGNAQTEMVDRMAERAGSTRDIYLVHPAASAGAPAGVAARGGRNWFLTEVDSERAINRRGPLLTREAWRTVPLLARQAYMALSRDDDLVLISWNGFSGSLSVFFMPERQADRPFYDRRLKTLAEYLRTHGGETDIPFERVDPAGPSGSFTSS